jgi:hypothetical protein
MHKVMLQKSIERENQVIRDNKLLRLTLYDLHSALKTMLEGQIRQYHQVMDLDVSFIEFTPFVAYMSTCLLFTLICMFRVTLLILSSSEYLWNLVVPT